MASDVDSSSATVSGFGWADAEALGCTWVSQQPPYVAAWRQDGATLEWRGDTVAEVLRQIEGWHLIRVRRGVASPASSAVRIVVGAGVAGPGGVNP